MSLFTGKGDNGTTYKFDSEKRFSKASLVTEALGTLDELNSYLGLVKNEFIELKNFDAVRNFQNSINVESGKDTSIDENEIDHFISQIKEIQENLFIIQAEIAGASKRIEMKKVQKMSDLINQIEKELPPIKTFLISGGSKISAMFDFARTVARRAERRVVAVADKHEIEISDGTLAYLNRLSSILYAWARLYNHKFGINEECPSYK